MFCEQVNKVELDASKIRVNPEKAEEETSIDNIPTTPEAVKERMEQINSFVKDVSDRLG